MGQPQNRPLDIVNAVIALLSNYDPTKLMYLNIHGKWLPGPKTMRERISNELWHRFWELRYLYQHNKELHRMFEILTCGKYTSLFTIESLLHKNAHLRESDIFAVFETVYQLIEYEALNINSKAYVTDWDYEGKKRKIEYILKVQKFFNRYSQVPGNDKTDKIFLDVLGQLRENSDLFCHISQIIAEEDKVRQSLDDILNDLKSSQARGEVYSIISERMPSSIGSLSKIPSALLRPCLDILVNQDIEITSGLPYYVSDILGSLVDVRATEVLIQVLLSTELKHTNIRCNLIYALGNVKQPQSLPAFTGVLDGPDSVTVYMSSGTHGYEQSLRWEKNEIIWALGKLGVDALPAMPVLMKQLVNQSRDTELALAWTMGMIGSAQKEAYGGIDAGIVTALMNLLTSNDGKVLEEVAFSLRRLGLPDFLHSLYFHNTATLPLIALKSSSSGLYELSETLFHLISVKKPVVLARDNPGHMYLFNRMMGIRLLKELFDPEQYQDYPYNEDEDDPRAFFADFMKQNSNKKLIILDGWMDETYFYQVIKIFYLYGYMDVIVNFRTTFSTKRLNLEHREGSLEHIKTCLSYVEKPVIEETEFYRNGDVLIYNLDNSMPSRLTSEQIGEIFARQKVETWGDYIRLGEFMFGNRRLEVIEQKVDCNIREIIPSIDYFTLQRAVDFSPDEARFNRLLNVDRKSQPNLLNTIELAACKIKRIEFYTQGQLAYGGYDGSIGILSGFNDHMLYTTAHDAEVLDICVIGGDICSVDVNGNLKITSFDRKEVVDIASQIPLINVLGTDRNHLIVTGHVDGSIMVWDILSKEVKKLVHEGGGVSCVAIDHAGTVYAGTDHGELLVWDISHSTLSIINGNELPISALALYPGNRILAGIGKPTGDKQGSVRIFDLKSMSQTIFIGRKKSSVSVLHSYFDGRVIAGTKVDDESRQTGKLIVYDLRTNSLEYTELGEHGSDIRDCIIIGPRIITCGTEKDVKQTLKIWGTSDYVNRELDKLSLMSETMVKPSYYRTLF
jgi:WD40 repeat protein